MAENHTVAAKVNAIVIAVAAVNVENAAMTAAALEPLLMFR